MITSSVPPTTPTIPLHHSQSIWSLHSGQFRGQKGLGPLKKPREMPHYMFCPRKKIISRTFKISSTLIVNLCYPWGPYTLLLCCNPAGPHRQALSNIINNLLTTVSRQHHSDVLNTYGTMTGSQLHKNKFTDRWVVPRSGSYSLYIYSTVCITVSLLTVFSPGQPMTGCRYCTWQ
jgi:hypothetical protein